MISLEHSEPSVLKDKEQNPSRPAEWKRIVTDLTSLGGVIRSPSPLSISWSSSASSIDNETCVPPKQFAHHHVVTKLNFDSCVPQNTMSPQVRAKVSRTVINCAAGSLEENCKASHKEQSKAAIASQDPICSISQEYKSAQEYLKQHKSPNVGYVASQDLFSGPTQYENCKPCSEYKQNITQNSIQIAYQGNVCSISPNKSFDVKQLDKEVIGKFQYDREEDKDSAVCASVSSMVENSSQLSPVIVKNRHVHSTSCKKRFCNDSMCKYKINVLSQEFSKSPVLGTSVKRKPLKVSNISKQSSKTISPNNQEEGNSRASSGSPILQFKRRRKLNFENSSRKISKMGPSEHHTTNLNLPTDHNSTENIGELKANLHLQLNLDNVNSLNKECPAESLVTESQVNRSPSPVLLPVKRKIKQRKCRRKIQICKTLGVCTNSENAEQILSHCNQSVTHMKLNNTLKSGLQTPDKEVKNAEQISSHCNLSLTHMELINTSKSGLQTPNKEIRERNVLRDISSSYTFSPSRKEISSPLLLKRTPENVKLKQNINRKHVRRKIMYVEGIKEIVPKNNSLVNSDIGNSVVLKNPEIEMLSTVNVTSANEPKSNIVIKNEPNVVLEESSSLKNDITDKSDLEAPGQIWQDNQKTEEECTYIGSVTECVRDEGIKMPETIKNSLCSPACFALNESTNLPKQNHTMVKETMNSTENKQMISDPLVPKSALVEQQLIAQNTSARSTFRTVRYLNKIKENKVIKKPDGLPCFEVKDCIKQQVNKPKPYTLTDMEEELIKSFVNAPITTLAITSATRYKERLKWLREQKNKNIDESCVIEHETQENFMHKVPVKTNDVSNIHLENKLNMLNRFKQICPLKKVETKHVLEENKSDRSTALETIGEGQEESLQNPALSELYIENEPSQKSDSIKIFDIKEKEQLPSQEISEKTSGSTNLSPVVQYDDISDCITPTKTSASASGEEMVPYCDSAKKKRRPRLSKDGLGARLQKLLLRQHSSTRIWQHELSRGDTHWRKTSVTLTISSIKREYSHLLLQGISYTSNIGEENKVDENMVSAQLIVVLDPDYAPQPLKIGSRIKIYPPWQTLKITKFDITLVLGVTCVEELPLQQNKKLMPLKPLKEETVYVANCSCLKLDPSAQRKCQFHFSLGGTEIFSHLLPHAEYIKGSSFGTTKAEHHPWHGTITDIVTRPGCLLTGSVWLQLRIIKVFHYIDRGSRKDVWSLLGRDSIGEYCEVILSSSPTEMDLSNCWTDITTQNVIGHLHRFTGFMLTDRRHKNRHQDLWTVLKDIHTQLKKVKRKCNSENKNSSSAAQEETKEELDSQKGVMALESADSMNVGKQLGEENSQLFFYVLSPCAENYQMKCVPEEIISEWPKIDKSSMYDILQQRDSGLSRHSCLVKLLYTATENLYVTDASLGQGMLPTYITIAVKPTCFLPEDVMKRRTKAVFLQDVLNDQGKLYVDRYSWIVSLEDMETKIRCLDYEESFKSKIEKLSVTIPKLDLNSSVNQLVTVTGAVVGVDEETAFAWPVCTKCENDLLVEVSPNKHVCQQCKKRVQTYQKMSLETFISCMWLPLSSSIKVKLLQESIMKLLPPTENNTEGYSLIAVLGQEIGPLTCLVVNARNQNFVLEEINIL